MVADATCLKQFRKLRTSQQCGKLKILNSLNGLKKPDASYLKQLRKLRN